MFDLVVVDGPDRRRIVEMPMFTAAIVVLRRDTSVLCTVVAVPGMLMLIKVAPWSRE